MNLHLFLKTKIYLVKVSDDFACNYNEDYNLFDFFNEGAPELTDLGESWTDYYDNLESTDGVEFDSADLTADDPPEEDEVNIIEGEDGPSDEQEDEIEEAQEDELTLRSGMNSTELPEDESKFQCILYVTYTTDCITNV